MKTERIESDVLNVLARSRVEGSVLALPEQLERKLYQRVDKVINALGGKWNRKARTHLFEGDATEVVETAILTQSYEKLPRDAFEFFPTSEKLAWELVARIDGWLVDGRNGGWRPRVLEPSAGDGSLVRAILARFPLVGGVSTDWITAIELDARHLPALNALLPTGGVVHGNFLEYESPEPFDAVVMNPPFRRQADIDHVTRAIGMLRVGGGLAAIMSAAITFRDNTKTKNFRALLDAHDAVITENDPNAFVEAGTKVRTVSVTLTKKKI